MQSFFQRNHRLLFYSLWLLLAGIQSAFTELIDDEAYYWVYSRFLDWGYYDHPPMVAIMIKIGYSLFHNEFGVRIISVIMSTLSLMIIERLLISKNAALFYAIVLSIVVLQFESFMAIPDTPLIFFTALFFLSYKNYLKKKSLFNTIFLGIVTAALLYSKYQALLVILFTLFSNPQLFKQQKVYIAGAITLLCFAPHLWWQYQHEWISFRYHLFESNVNPYEFNFTLDYLVGQILIAGPLAGFILLPAAFSYSPQNLFEKALRFSLIGIYLVFLFSSFRGKTEANWTAPALIPMIILSHQFLNYNVRWRTLLFKLLPLSLVIALFIRVVIVADILPYMPLRMNFHAWKIWPAQMRERTKNLPIVFNNSYGRASKYWFYTGQMTYSLNHYKDRRNNYNLWPIEDSLLGKPVYILDIHNLNQFTDSLKMPLTWIGYRYDSSFASFAKVSIKPDRKNYTLNEGESLTLSCNVSLPERYDLFIKSHPEIKTELLVGFSNKQKWIKEELLPFTLRQIATDKKFVVQIDPKLKKGKYFLRFGVSANKNLPTHNSEKIRLIVK
jgi:dolichyl-phosphate-mannose-protein mannosyltransferase